MTDVLNFPGRNARLDVSDLPLNAEDMAEKIKLIRTAYYSEIADELLEMIVTKIALLKLNKNNDDEISEHFPKDIMLLREVLIGLMCRFSGMDHPTHEVFELLYEMTEDYDEESGELLYNYKQRNS